MWLITALVLLTAIGAALGLALTGHGSGADWLDWPREDWR